MHIDLYDEFYMFMRYRGHEATVRYKTATWTASPYFEAMIVKSLKDKHGDEYKKELIEIINAGFRIENVLDTVEIFIDNHIKGATQLTPLEYFGRQ